MFSLNVIPVPELKAQISKIRLADKVFPRIVKVVVVMNEMLKCDLYR